MSDWLCIGCRERYDTYLKACPECGKRVVLAPAMPKIAAMIAAAKGKQ